MLERGLLFTERRSLKAKRRLIRLFFTAEGSSREQMKPAQRRLVCQAINQGITDA
jgi:hypothetical protein